jgi:Domain of unknown function (DUF397)
MPEPTSGVPCWRKSTRSGDSAECVEVALLGDHVGVRDSKDPTGPALLFPVPVWRAFVAAVKSGDLHELRKRGS